MFYRMIGFKDGKMKEIAEFDEDDIEYSNLNIALGITIQELLKNSDTVSMCRFEDEYEAAEYGP